MYQTETFPYEFGTSETSTASDAITYYGTDVFNGDIEMVGDFIVDVPFTFTNCKIRFDEDKKILIESGQTLELKECLLFSCREWNGIELEDGAALKTLVTRIEDAKVAIEAPRGSTLYIDETTFNRNRVGIKLGYDGNVDAGPPVAPHFTKFSNNTFNCTSTMNTGGISTTGIQIYKCSPTIGAPNSVVSTFQRMRYGIRVEDQPPGLTTFIRRCIFLGLYFDGIYVSAQGLNVFLCDFTNCAANCINAASTSNLIVRNCHFNYDDGVYAYNSTQNTNYRGIYCNAFAPASTVDVRFCGFDIQMESPYKQVDGILFNGGATDVGGNTAISISRNTFTLEVYYSRAVRLTGEFLNAQYIDIVHNSFTLSRVGTPPLTIGLVIESGIKRRLNIASNDFYAGKSLLTFNTTDCVRLGGSIDDDMSATARNFFGDNHWHFPCTEGTHDEIVSPEFAYQLWVNSFSNTTYCDNEFFDVVYPVTFTFDNPNTEFTQNTFLGYSYGLELTSNGKIGAQPNMGNHWERIYEDCTNQIWILYVNPFLGFDARCNPPGNAVVSHFLVHQPQSTTTTWYPYHPLIIDPDTDNEFFEQDPTGSPSNDCLPFAGGPPKEEYEDVADGMLDTLVYSAAEIGARKRALFRYLTENPTYQSSYVSYGSFVSGHTGTSMARFVQVARLLDQPSPSLPALADTLQELREQMDALYGSLYVLDSLLHLNPTNATLLADKVSVQGDLLALSPRYAAQVAIYDAEREKSWIEADSINTSVTPVTDVETAEKQLNHILLDLALSGDPIAAQDQDFIDSLAQLYAYTGGYPVYRARAFQSPCEDTDYPGEVVELESELENTQMDAELQTEERDAKTMAASAQVLSANNTVISLSRTDGGALQVFDLAGRLLYTAGFAGNETRNVNLAHDLPAGSYLGRVVYSTGQTELIHFFYQP